MKVQTGTIKKPKFILSFLVSFLIMLLIFTVTGMFIAMPEYLSYKKEIEEDEQYYIDNLFDSFCAYTEYDPDYVSDVDSRWIKLVLLDHYCSTGQNIKLRMFHTKESKKEYYPPEIDYSVPVVEVDTSQTAYLNYITDEGMIYTLFLADDKYLEYFNTPQVKSFSYADYDVVRTIKKAKKNDFICEEFYVDLDNGTFIPVELEILRNDDPYADDSSRTGVKISIVPDDVEGFTHITPDMYTSYQLGVLAGSENKDKIKWSKDAERLGYNMPLNLYFDYYSTKISSVPFAEVYPDQILLGLSLILLVSYVLAFIPATISYKIKLKRYQIFEYKRMAADAMAHDLKTPIAAISAYAENLSNHIGTDKQDYYLAKILEKTNEMNGLVNGILDYSRSEKSEFRIKKEEIDIGQMIEDIISDNEYLINKNALKISFDKKNVLIKTDRELFRQAIANLIGNAVIHSKEGTTIDIICKDNEIDIINTAKETIENINEIRQPFVKGSSSRGNKGTGLGLAIADNNLMMLKHKLDLEIEEKRFKAKVKF